MNEAMEPIDPAFAAMLMGRTPEPCEPFVEISSKVLARLLDVVEFGDQLERVEKDRLLSSLKELLGLEQPELWVIHCVGPNELHPMISKEAADRHAAELAEMFSLASEKYGCRFDVIPSPFSPLEHFEILAEETVQHRLDLLEHVKALEEQIAASPAPAVAMPQAIALPMPVMPEQPEDAIDDSWMDGYNAALRMREECIRAIEAAGLGSPAVVNQQLTTAALDVLAERQRQITAEGWTPEHDAEHDGGELAAAGAAYALHAADHLHPYSQGDGGNEAPEFWPWHNELAGRGEGPVKTEPSWWKPGLPRRDLIKAGGLILAEIERLDRASAPGAELPAQIAKKSCIWKRDEETGAYNTGCGQTWYFTDGDGTPAEHGALFCHHCGLGLVVEQRELRAYQVGDNDIVAAYDPAGAIQVLEDFTIGGYGFDEDDVDLVSDKMLDNTEAFDQDEGKTITLEKTLRQELAERTEPGYLCGLE